MEVYNYYLALRLRKSFIRGLKGAGKPVFNEQVAHEVYYRDDSPARIDVDYSAPRGCSVGEIERTRYKRAFVEVVKYFLSAESVIAERYCVYSAVKQKLCRNRSKSVTVGGVFAVTYYKINALYLFERGQP